MDPMVKTAGDDRAFRTSPDDTKDGTAATGLRSS